MIAALLDTLLPYILGAAAFVGIIFGYGRHQRGRGRDEVRQETRINALEKDQEAANVAQDAARSVDGPDRDRLRERWTRPD